MLIPLFCLVDCNNFYAACERAFNPSLNGKPIVVLSNNDGCIIARSAEAKSLGIPMGAPYFKWKSFIEHHQVKVFSSNYELYGDMSHRIMTILKELCSVVEIYSIDEAFIFFDNISIDEIETQLLMIREKIKMYTGIPVSIGCGKTKTIAKLANLYAKKYIPQGIYLMLNLSNEILSTFPAKEVWGIGYQLAKRLNHLNIKTAADLYHADGKYVRLHSNVQVEKTIQELKGVSCIPLDEYQARKQIISSRSFGKIITELSELEEAISYYVSIACEKLRKQESVAAAIYIFIHTSLFNEKSSQYGNAISVSFLPSDETGFIIQKAKIGLKKIYRRGYAYTKAGIMLMELSSRYLIQQDMFAKNSSKKQMLMLTLDQINKTFGKSTLFYVACGIDQKWKIKNDFLSSRYTTRWDELLKVRC